MSTSDELQRCYAELDALREQLSTAERERDEERESSLAVMKLRDALLIERDAEKARADKAEAALTYVLGMTETASRLDMQRYIRAALAPAAATSPPGGWPSQDEVNEMDLQASSPLPAAAKPACTCILRWTRPCPVHGACDECHYGAKKEGG